jgi:hypothetical protein
LGQREVPHRIARGEGLDYGQRHHRPLGAAPSGPLHRQAAVLWILRHELTALLDTLEIGRLILTGYAADICVLFTAADAHMHGYAIFGAPEDTTASETVERKRWALEIMSQGMRATTAATAALRLEAWTEDIAIFPQPRCAQGTVCVGREAIAPHP